MFIKLVCGGGGVPLHTNVCQGALDIGKHYSSPFRPKQFHVASASSWGIWGKKLSKTKTRKQDNNIADTEASRVCLVHSNIPLPSSASLCMTAAFDLLMGVSLFCNCSQLRTDLFLFRLFPQILSQCPSAQAAVSHTLYLDMGLLTHRHRARSHCSSQPGLFNFWYSLSAICWWDTKRCFSGCTFFFNVEYFVDFVCGVW